MGILARGRPLVYPLHLGCIDGCGHIDPAEQLIAHHLGTLIHGQRQVLHSQLDFASELLASSLVLKVVFTEFILEFDRVAFKGLLLVVEG